MRLCLNKNVKPVFVLLALTISCAAQSGGRIERQLGMMGTGLKIVVEAPSRAAALEASESAVRALENAEARLSTWSDQSELAQLNLGLAPAGPLLHQELADAHDWERRTAGCFNPRLAALVRCWDLRGGGRWPAPAEIEAALASNSGYEEGGFGKGAGLRAALRALADSAAQRALLDLGGQLAFHGRGPFRVEVAHPGDRTLPVVAFEVSGGSVATSGNSEHRLMPDGIPFGHILDPRSGRPADDFGSMTVWADDPLAADCLATGLYVMGPDAALAWAESNPGIEILVLQDHPDGLRVRASSGLRAALESLLEGLELTP